MACALVLLVFVSGVLVASQSVAQAINCNYKSWPGTGGFQFFNWAPNKYSVTFKFQLTTNELCTLKQAAPYLEIDFRIRGFDVPAGWDGYAVAETNIPGAIHDEAFEDPQYIANPAVTRIFTGQLQAGVIYYATLIWEANVRPGMTPTIQFVWVPSRWANTWDAVQWYSCYVVGRNGMDHPWCIFPVDNAAVLLLGASTFPNGGYPDGVMPLGNNIRGSWGPGGLSIGPGQSDPSNPPNPSIPSPGVDYRIDRTILHAPNGSLYVMAGGAKFYFGSMTEFSGLGYSAAGMVYLPDSALSEIPNMPRDGTILHSGGGQIYVVAAGSKFHFGSMSEYYAQGYTNGQMIKVPQSPLDAIGDAPGNRPSDGAVLQHPDGRLFVVVGGVKFQFGTMNEYGSLGYSNAQIIRVAGASLDAIPTASASTSPSEGTVLRSGGGQLYVIAGAAKFYFGSITEFNGLGYGAWHNVPQAPLDAIGDAPGNVPRNGTVLRSGGGQVYVMAGGAKFYFGSMTEYHAQGYSDGQLIKVPQSPLDLVGDAPGNMPRNGTVVQRPDGVLYVIAGGVRWVFGSMTQYYQLGYTDGQVVRVSWTPLDGIADASAGSLPSNETVLQGSDATVWVMKDGLRRSFSSSQQFVDLGYSWSSVTRVPDGQLAGIPDGGPLS